MAAAGILAVAAYPRDRPDEAAAAAPAAIAAPRAQATPRIGKPAPVEPPPAIARPAAAFGSQRDLWAYAHDQFASGRPDAVYEASVAAQSCLAVMSETDALALFVSGGNTGILGDLTPERQLAVAELNARCDGFSRAGKEATQRFIDGAQDLLRDAAGGRFFSDDGAPLSERQVMSLLDSGEPNARATAAQMAYPYWRAALDIPDADPRAGALATAAALASCDLGMDCSAGGFPALAACAFGAKCAGGLYADWQAGLPDSQVALIDAYRRQMREAVDAHDWASLGLATQRRERQ